MTQSPKAIITSGKQHLNALRRIVLFISITSITDTIKQGIKSVFGGAINTGINGPSHRDILPEPFDWYDHLGNTIPSIAIGLGIALTAALISRRQEWATASRTRKIAFTTGATLTAAVNLYVETKFGAHGSTPDPIDLAYGVGAGVMAASLVDVQETSRHEADQEPFIHRTDFPGSSSESS